MYRRTLIAVAVMLIMMSPVVHAEDMSSLMLTDVQIGLIRDNCHDVQSTLQRVQTSDALARVNLGQQYEIISTKLMAPLNSRISLNRLDGVDLAQTTVDFNNKLSDFRSLYQQYDQTMLRGVEMNCQNQPVAFYDTISLARQHRAAVRGIVEEMSGLVTKYQTQFEVLAQKSLVNGGASQ